ncbi:hypothetical protein J2R96_006311 [Bradyrhizobium elkanii]|uniref:Uncharacterized protein n=1 Tax=Bradyrhizobium brasilense TaxID=1419277 RepID=A0ABY8JQ92_9BRAD|nr:hypothetical protein [Bradyrhizobium brasilense]MCP1913831.1 hypothetical protein [Bradyrhizobium elkanii]WFU66198.1 hypothetical protein QA636_12075 [Bradyrhizobium brasilense]
MQDMRAQLEKLRVEAEECELISKLATNAARKRCSPNWQRITEHSLTKSSAQ